MKFFHRKKNCERNKQLNDKIDNTKKHKYQKIHRVMNNKLNQKQFIKKWADQIIIHLRM